MHDATAADPEPVVDAGFTTAELLANAALAILALGAIWFALQQMGVELVDWIQTKIGM